MSSYQAWLCIQANYQNWFTLITTTIQFEFSSMDLIHIPTKKLLFDNDSLLFVISHLWRINLKMQDNAWVNIPNPILTCINTWGYKNEDSS
ncbi:hypothetical protein R50912_10070 [Paenibacillus sp. FSL R5-0912]|nr:hypothetical protein R50912_10070 [Paenibacillus sp. FSL R5-0912]